MRTITKFVRTFVNYIFNFQYSNRLKEYRTYVRSNISQSITIRVIKTIIYFSSNRSKIFIKII